MGVPSGLNQTAPLVASRSEAALLSADDWGETVYVYGTDIVPGSLYEARADCGTSMPALSDGSWAATDVWGDVTGAYVDGLASPPDGVADFRDISGVVNTFLDAPGAPLLLRADLFGCRPDQVVDFADVAAAVSAFMGVDYPQASLCTVPCGP